MENDDLQDDFVVMNRLCPALLVFLAICISGCWRWHERIALPDAGPRADGGVPPDVRWLLDTATDEAALDAYLDPDAGHDAALDVGPVDCTPGGLLVHLPGAPPFRMEATEVTQREYARFLACELSPAVVPPCERVDVSPGTRFDPDLTPEHPVGGVTFCAAAAYCAWAGRRLCTLEEWEPVCERVSDVVTWTSRHVLRGPRVCVASAYSDGEWSVSLTDQSVPVGEASECRSDVAPYDAIHDLIGNVSEWVRTDGALLAPGGSYAGGPYDPCHDRDLHGIDERLDRVGFRCCAD